MNVRHFYTLTFFLLTFYCSAQNANPDTTFLSSARKQQITLYHNFIKGQSRLYSGAEYRDYLSRDGEHPYFETDDWSFGYIVYDDEYYENVPMFYDISRDRIIGEHLLTRSKIELAAEKVSRFSLGNHSFVRLVHDRDNIIKDGFYEVLHDGATKVYARREKSLQEKTEGNTIVARFDEKNRFYILKDGVYHPVRSKGSVLDVFSNVKQDMKAFLKKNTIKFKANRESAIAQMAACYDAQTH